MTSVGTVHITVGTGGADLGAGQVSEHGYVSTHVFGGYFPLAEYVIMISVTRLKIYP